MKLSKVISDGVVFQRGKALLIRGSGAGTVEVNFLGAVRKYTVSDGAWVVDVGTYPAGGPYELSISLDGVVTLVRDVYIGDVYLFAGQSNIQFKLSESGMSADKIVNDSLCRTYVVARPEEGDPIPGKWLASDEASFPAWSAFAYWFVREKREQSPDIACAALICCQGASTIQSWLPSGALTGDAYIPFPNRHYDSIFHIFGAWNSDGFLWNRMLTTFAPFSCAELIWYQGESNTSPAESAVYDKMLVRLAYDWRAALCDTRLPLVIIEIHSFNNGAAGWRDVQLAQLRAPDLIPHCVTVMNESYGEKDLIHPTDKRPLARAAAAHSVR